MIGGSLPPQTKRLTDRATPSKTLWKCPWMLVFGIAFSAFTLSASAQIPTAPLPPASAEVEARLKKLETELRCLVCQNQTLAESPANLAGDLRREIRGLANQGKSNDEIKSFLQVRYGDFVLYKPPMSARTYLLWGAPFGLLLFGLCLLVWFVKRQAKIPLGEARTAAENDARARAERLLRE